MIHASASLESAISMLSCTKLGIHFSVIFEDLAPEAISKRMESYVSLTSPLIDFYDKKQIMININANKSILEVSKEIDLIMQDWCCTLIIS